MSFGEFGLGFHCAHLRTRSFPCVRWRDILEKLFLLPQRWHYGIFGFETNGSDILLSCLLYWNVISVYSEFKVFQKLHRSPVLTHLVGIGGRKWFGLGSITWNALCFVWLCRRHGLWNFDELKIDGYLTSARRLRLMMWKARKRWRYHGAWGEGVESFPISLLFFLLFHLRNGIRKGTGWSIWHLGHGVSRFSRKLRSGKFRLA